MDYKNVSTETLNRAANAFAGVFEIARLPRRIFDSVLDGFFARSSLQPNVVLESNSFEMLRNFVRSNDAVSFQIQVGTPVARNQDGITARVIEERAFPRQPLTVAQLKGRHLPQPALRFLASLREAMGGVGQG